MLENIEDNKVIAELIDMVLEYSDCTDSIDSILQKIIGDDSYKYSTRILKRIESEGIVYVSGRKVSPNNTTYKIQEKGGYEEYLRHEKIKLDIEEKRKENEYNSYYWQGKVNKWLFKSRYLPHILSIVAIIISIISLIINVFLTD